MEGSHFFMEQGIIKIPIKRQNWQQKVILKMLTKSLLLNTCVI